MNDKASGNRVVRFMPKGGNGSLKLLDWNNQYMEAFCYPLLFNLGERGWSKELKLPMCDYLANRYLQCEFPMPSLLDSEKLLFTNRFCAMPKLGQTFIVDGVSRMVDNKLKWVRNNQKTIFGGMLLLKMNV
jgi:hypothetical protein